MPGFSTSCALLNKLAAAIRSSSNIVVLAGAGISVSAGIPDFRSPGTGLYDNLQKYNLPFAEAIFDLQYFKKNPWPFYEFCRETWPGKHKPTKAHNFLSLLQNKGVDLIPFIIMHLELSLFFFGSNQRRKTIEGVYTKH